MVGWTGRTTWRVRSGCGESGGVGGGVGGDGAGGALASLAPQKVNADLKRDIKGKLDRLERRTQRALVDLLKERLEREAEEEDGGLD